MMDKYTKFGYSMATLGALIVVVHFMGCTPSQVFVNSKSQAIKPSKQQLFAKNTGYIGSDMNQLYRDS